MKLLSMGFEDFVRVGNLKKIAKTILPFSAQSKPTSGFNQDLKDLHEMLEDENLDDSDRLVIENAIKVFQLNENQKIIDTAFVVGITCHSSRSEQLNNLSCNIVIIDEASQLSEPMSMLPISRFDSQIALLVGDPQQLMPTLSYDLSPQVSNTEHGLELTLFERLAQDNWFTPKLLRTQYRVQMSNFSATRKSAMSAICYFTSEN